MNKARKQSHRPGTLKRLFRESLILSSTRFVSSRVFRFFESGLVSPLLTSVQKVDRFIRNNATNPLLEKTELRKKFIMPVRNGFASLLSRSRIMNKISALRSALLGSSLRSIGIFLFTFGIYATAIFILKRYVDLGFGEADTDDLSVSAITVLVGMLFTLFGDKSVLASLGNGRIIGAMLSGSLGVNESTLNRIGTVKPPTAALTSFLLGSLFGVSTLFFRTWTIIFGLAVVILVVTIMCIPEFGLLLAVSTLSFLPLKYTSVIAFLTLVSYLIKCLRLKRNFRFGTADSIMLLFFIALFFSMISSGGSLNNGEIDILIFVSLYFAARNMICTERLVYQTFNALCNGLCVGMILYLIGEYATKIPHVHFRAVAQTLSENVMEPDMLAMLIVATLPFVISSYTALGTKQPEILFAVMLVGCVAVSDSFVLAAMVLCVFFLYIALVYRAACGAMFGAAIIFPTAFVLLWDLCDSTTVALFRELMYDEILDFGAEIKFSNFWEALNGIGGVMTVVLFSLAVLMSFQRIFGGTVVNKSEFMQKIGGTVAVSAVVIVILAFMFNPFSDLRMVLAMSFIFGLCGAVYKVGKSFIPDYQEVEECKDES